MADEELGDVLKTLREAKGMTQEELARRAGVTRPYLTMLETGQKSNPSMVILARIADALGASITQLLGVEFWRAEPERVADPKGPGGNFHPTREAAEAEARIAGLRYVAKYVIIGNETRGRCLGVRERK